MAVRELASAITREGRCEGEASCPAAWRSAFSSILWARAPSILFVEGRPRFQARMDSIAPSSDLTLLRSRVNAAHGARIEGMDSDLVFASLPSVVGQGFLSFGGHHGEIDPRTGWLHSEGEAGARWEFQGEADWVIALLSRAALERTAATLAGKRLKRGLTFLPKMKGVAMRWSRHLLSAALLSEAAESHDRLKANIAEAAMTCLLLEQPNSYSEILRECRPDVCPRSVRQALAFMDEHLDECPSVAAIARHVGVGMRALQLAFQKHKGCSPGEWLRNRRLEEAHGMLVQGGISVTEAAYAWGFWNLGEFAALYRARYERNPSDTVRNSSR